MLCNVSLENQLGCTVAIVHLSKGRTRASTVFLAIMEANVCPKACRASLPLCEWVHGLWLQTACRHAIAEEECMLIITLNSNMCSPCVTVMFTQNTIYTHNLNTRCCLVFDIKRYLGTCSRTGWVLVWSIYR